MTLIRGLWSALAFGVVSASPLFKRSISGPVTSVDFPDPSVVQDGNSWYAFASQSLYDNTNIKIQLATSNDFQSWQIQQGYDALPTLPGWAIDNGEVWAPDVTQLSDGSFLMYFAATPSQDSKKKCIGTARSGNVRGPYQADPEPFDCALDQGGSLDASAFVDSDGTRYVLWKLDGNSLGNGGACNNDVPPIAPTPILIQQVQADGVTKVGSTTTLIVNDPVDGPNVEAPVMVRRQDGTYVLFFASNCFSSPKYATSYATSTSPKGPFTKSTTPLYVAGTYGLSGPGGLDPTADGDRALFHALQGQGPRRFMYTAQLSYSGTTVQG